MADNGGERETGGHAPRFLPRVSTPGSRLVGADGPHPARAECPGSRIVTGPPAFPGRSPWWHSWEAHSPVTVAGPRRTHTGFLAHPRAGSPGIVASGQVGYQPGGQP